MIGKYSFPEANTAHIFVNYLAGPEKPDMDRIEVRILKAPEPNVVQLGKRHRITCRILDRFSRTVNRRVCVWIERSFVSGGWTLEEFDGAFLSRYNLVAIA